MRFLKKVPLHPTFYLFFLWFLFCGELLEFFTFSLVLSLHEFAHYFVSKKCGYSLDKFYIAPYGASLTYKEKQFERNDEIKIALAGPLTNLVLSFFVISLWWIFPTSYVYTKMFAMENLFLAIFNLIPAYPLDGGRVVASLLANKYGREKAIKKLKVSNGIFSIVFLALFIFSLFYSFNPTFALMAIFLFSGLFEGEFSAKYRYSFIFKKKIKNFSKPRHLAVREDVAITELLKKIESDTYTIFDVITKEGDVKFITENQIIAYCVKKSGYEKVKKMVD